MSLNKKELLSMFADQLLKCYDENGKLLPDYYNNIKFPDLDKKEYEILRGLQ